MRIKNRRLSIIFKLLLCTAAALGILIQVGAFEGTLRWSVLNYYTLMSNALCALYFFFEMLSIGSGADTPLPGLKGALVTGITITGLVYHFVLAGSFQMQGTLSLSNVLLHYAAPVMAVVFIMSMAKSTRPQCDTDEYAFMYFRSVCTHAERAP